MRFSPGNGTPVPVSIQRALWLEAHIVASTDKASVLQQPKIFATRADSCAAPAFAPVFTFGVGRTIVLCGLPSRAFGPGRLPPKRRGLARILGGRFSRPCQRADDRNRSSAPLPLDRFFA